MLFPVAAAAAGLLFVSSPGFHPVAGEAGSADYARSLRCAAATAVIAGILQSGEPSAEDKASAARFQSLSERWLVQAIAVNPRGEQATFSDFDLETKGLTGSITGSTSQAAAEAMLDKRMTGCDENSAPALPTEPAAATSNPALRPAPRALAFPSVIAMNVRAAGWHGPA